MKEDKKRSIPFNILSAFAQLAANGVRYATAEGICELLKIGGIETTEMAVCAEIDRNPKLSRYISQAPVFEGRIVGNKLHCLMVFSITEELAREMKAIAEMEV